MMGGWARTESRESSEENPLSWRYGLASRRKYPQLTYTQHLFIFRRLFRLSVVTWNGLTNCSHAKGKAAGKKWDERVQHNRSFCLEACRQRRYRSAMGNSDRGRGEDAAWRSSTVALFRARRWRTLDLCRISDEDEDRPPRTHEVTLVSQTIPRQARKHARTHARENERTNIPTTKRAFLHGPFRWTKQQRNDASVEWTEITRQQGDMLSKTHEKSFPLTRRRSPHSTNLQNAMRPVQQTTVHKQQLQLFISECVAATYAFHLEVHFIKPPTSLNPS